MSAPDARRRLEHLTPAEIAPLETQFEPGYPEQLLAMARVIYVELLNQDVPAAELLARQLVEAVRRDLGGRGMYINKGMYLEADARARQIVAEFNGRNVPYLAAKHGLSDERVRQIVREVKLAREAELRARQGALPLDIDSETT